MPKVEVVPYDENWEHLFEETKKILTDVFGGNLVKVEHFGSTSIPETAAKPIIDIFVFVRDTSDISKYDNMMRRYGYKPKGVQELTKCFVYEKHDENSGKRTQKVNVCKEDNAFSANALLFRDYLRENKEACAKYQKLKEELSQKYPDNLVAYGNGKLDFITKTIKEARCRHGKDS